MTLKSLLWVLVRTAFPLLVLATACDGLTGDTAANRLPCAERVELGQFDVSSTATGLGREWQYDIRVAGADYHVVITTRNGATMETIGVDGGAYMRSDQGSWASQEGVALSDFHAVSGADALCPETGSLDFVGDESLDGVRVRRYRRSDSTVLQAKRVGGSDSPAVSEQTATDYWVDSTGLLMQLKRVVTQFTTDGAELSRVETRSVVSGVGEPNTITTPQ